jgi:hypothetical protein
MLRILPLAMTVVGGFKAYWYLDHFKRIAREKIYRWRIDHPVNSNR